MICDIYLKYKITQKLVKLKKSNFYKITKISEANTKTYRGSLKDPRWKSS